ncbi:hypothetical protein DPM19_19430 [Actinomadura craniellae]|uniref:Uncharacterized protein n=1 Tax=Actinomadura craniellae TaxID=2231787 RepID=A0A365H401_9ACTN|nr:hypothetical protein [Actinomadura craniellae]RAY13821.1 hypothetical protein DPM19_19430 [Actinomadura craniellae]
MAQMLYYPGSTPPEAALFQAVLYWDSVASIAPHEDEWRRQAVMTERGRTMLELRDLGLYEPISLFDAADSLRNAFAVERNRLLAQVTREELEPPAEDADFDGVSNWYSISRFPADWTTWLVDHGLARWREGGYGVRVNQKLRHVLFAVAADYLVRQNEGPHATGPRRFTYTGDDGFFWAVNSPAARTRRCWQVDVGDLFPMPAPGTDITKVIAFRDRYGDERRRLVQEVTRLQSDLAARHDDNPHEVFEGMRLALADAVTDLDKAAQASKLTWIRGGVFSFVALGAGATAAAVSPEQATTLPAAVTAASLAMQVIGGLAVNVATGQIAPSRSTDTSHRYLQRTRNEYGTPRTWHLDR